MYSNIWIWSFTNNTFDGDIGINQVYLSTPTVTIFDWYSVVTRQEEIILFHCDPFNLIQVYFHMHTIKHPYQQSINDHTPTTSFNQLMFQSAATENTTIALLYCSNKQSSNEYYDNDYESLVEANVELIMAIFQQAELIAHYVLFDKVLHDTMLFGIICTYCINHHDAAILYVVNNHLNDNLLYD